MYTLEHNNTGGTIKVQSTQQANMRLVQSKPPQPSSTSNPVRSKF